MCTEYMYFAISVHMYIFFCFCTVWSTLIRISLTKALVLWWCDNKSDLIWFDSYFTVINMSFTTSQMCISTNLLRDSKMHLKHLRKTCLQESDLQKLTLSISNQSPACSAWTNVPSSHSKPPWVQPSCIWANRSFSRVKSICSFDMSVVDNQRCYDTLLNGLQGSKEGFLLLFIY